MKASQPSYEDISQPILVVNKGRTDIEAIQSKNAAYVAGIVHFAKAYVGTHTNKFYL